MQFYIFVIYLLPWAYFILLSVTDDRITVMLKRVINIFKTANDQKDKFAVLIVISFQFSSYPSKSNCQFDVTFFKLIKVFLKNKCIYCIYLILKLK